MTRLAVTLMAVVAAIAACTSSSSEAPAGPTSSSTPSAQASVTFTVLRAYGELSDPVPAGLKQAYDRDTARTGRAYLLAAPDVIVYSSSGCDNFFMTPQRPATITPNLIKWRLAFNHEGGPSCDTTHLVFIRLSRAVFDMRHNVRAVIRISPARVFGHQVSRGYAAPAPDLARWAAPRR